MNAGDFNSDGKLDLAVNHERTLGGSNNILVLGGNGMGGFTPLSTIEPEPAYSRVADFNLDGKLDIMSVRNPSLGLYLAMRNGSFSAPVVIDGGPATGFTILISIMTISRM